MRDTDVDEILKDGNLPKLDMSPIKDVLKEMTPKIKLTKTGRIRLVHALSYKYGDNFRNFEPAAKALAHFDDSHEHLKTYLHLKGYVRG